MKVAVQAAAPRLPVPGLVPQADNPVVEILPPFGTNPPTGPLSGQQLDLTTRSIHNDPRELWYLTFPSKLTPSQVLQILRSALGGDVWQQWQLMSLMLDSWPMLRKCSHEVRQAVSNVKYRVRPHVDEEGEEPGDDAKEQADAVSLAMRRFRPDPFSDEKDFCGTVYDATDAILNGLALTELMWTPASKLAKGGLFLPRASAWVHPRHYTFGNDGNLAVFDDTYNRLNWNLAKSPGTALSSAQMADKFLCFQFNSRSGSSLGAGLMRPLAWYWSAMVFNREWMLQFAQKYGNPFLDATYKPGTPQPELDKLSSFMSQASVNGWNLHVEGSELKVYPAQSLGTDNAHAHIMCMADEACQYLLLGQTATTTATPGKLGSSDTQSGVKREVLEGAAKWVAGGLGQFAGAVCRRNWGTDDEAPQIEADFTEPTDPLAQAQRDQIFIVNSVPVLAEEFYRNNDMTLPEEGDLVLVGGKIGKLAATDQEVGGPDPLPPQFGPDGEPMDGGGGFGQDDRVGARAGAKLRRVVQAASSEELRDLRELVQAARVAPHRNGEWEAVKVTVNKIAARCKL